MCFARPLWQNHHRPMSCPDNNLILDYVDGALDEEQTKALDMEKIRAEAGATEETPN